MDNGIYFLDDRPIRRRRRWNWLGISGLLASIGGVFTLGLLSPLGLMLSVFGLFHKPRGAAAIVGTALGGAGTAFLALVGWGIINGATMIDNAHRMANTERSMHQAVVLIEDYQANQGALPEDIEGNKLLISAEFEDAWGQALRYEREGTPRYVIRSAGPDQTFDTVDDLVRS